MSLFRRKHTRARTGAVSVSAAAIAEGWHGLPWGAPLSAFKAKYPHAHRTENDWWHTGESPEPFCGIPMAITQYGFNTRDQLSTVTFIPDTRNRPQLSVAAVNEMGPPEDMDLRWTLGDVVVEIKLAGVMATMTHPAYANR